MTHLYQKTYLARPPPARCVTRVVQGEKILLLKSPYWTFLKRQAGNPPPDIGWMVVTANGGDTGEVVSLEAGTTGGGGAV